MNKKTIIIPQPEYKVFKQDDKEITLSEQPKQDFFKQYYEQIVIQKDKAILKALIKALDKDWLLWLKGEIEKELQ